MSFAKHDSITRATGKKSKSILTLVVASGVGALLLVVLAAVWAGAESDAAALDRQRQLVTARLNDQVSKVSQDMRLMGGGYASLLADFQDLNSWPPEDDRNAAPSHVSSSGKFSELVKDVFGYDMVFIVDATGELSFSTDKATAKRFKWVRPLLIPMLRGVRERQGRTSVGNEPPGEGELASAELMRLEGRPSITGIIPINSAIETQAPLLVTSAKQQYLIAFRFLDGAVLDALSREQGLNGARFARTADADLTEVAFQIEASATKEPLGFIVWTPDLPGSRVIGRLTPALSIVTVLLGALFSLLIVRLRRSWRELEISELNARHLSLHDVLTTLPNRALFISKLEDAYSGAVTADRCVIVAFIDLDRFKEVNDTFGHAVGDELIISAAERMRSLLSPTDTLARIGGDEFALILPNQGSLQNVGVDFCGKLIAELSRPFILGNGTALAQIGCSIGISLMSGDGQLPREILRQADVALYHAKTSGRGRCFRYEYEMDASKLARSELTESLRAELETTFCGKNQSPSSQSNLEVFYQTIHKAAGDNRICGAEALIRWRHPTRGMLSPDEFIPLAEETGLIDLLGRFVLESACMTAATWPIDHVVAVNVSPRQLKRVDFAEEVLSVLHTTGLSPDRLELELTETALLENADQAQRTLKKLRRLGVKVALDDFGTGYSSLSHLIRFGIDRIKIDRSFVSLIDTKSDGTAIVAAVTGLARNLGISTTAEGVETEGQRDFLSALGCSELQGYLFSKPRPVQDLPIETSPRHRIA